MLSKDIKRDFLFALYIAFMVMVNTLGSKIISIFSIRVSVGIFFLPVLFLITDVISEVYSDNEAAFFVNISSLVLVLLSLATYICIVIKPNANWPYQEQYKTIFGSSLRMTLASLVSFIISQRLDVWLFGKIRKLTKTKHLWIRNNIATITSQFVDTTIFEFLAFYKITEAYNARFIFSLIIPYFAFKVVLALLDTPFCYLGVKWMNNSK